MAGTRVIVILVDEERDGGASADLVSSHVKELVNDASGHNYGFDELRAGPTVSITGLDDLVRRGAGPLGLTAHYWSLSSQ